MITVPLTVNFNIYNSESREGYRVSYSTHIKSRVQKRLSSNDLYLKPNFNGAFALESGFYTQVMIRWLRIKPHSSVVPEFGPKRRNIKYNYSILTLLPCSSDWHNYVSFQYLVFIYRHSSPNRTVLQPLKGHPWLRTSRLEVEHKSYLNYTIRIIQECDTRQHHAAYADVLGKLTPIQ